MASTPVSTPSNLSHVGRLDTTAAKVMFFFVDIVLCYLCSFVRKGSTQSCHKPLKRTSCTGESVRVAAASSVVGSNTSITSFALRSLLPGVVIGIIVPQAYLTSEIAGCWISQGWTSVNSSYKAAPDICANIFVSNDALMSAFR